LIITIFVVLIKQGMTLLENIERGIKAGLAHHYNFTVTKQPILITPTKKEFEGDFTVVVFPFSGVLKAKPEELGAVLGHYLIENDPSFAEFNVIKGFLNLTLSNRAIKNLLEQFILAPEFGKFPTNGQKVLVESSSPNTNKPLHLGHIRNILLGWSVYKIMEAAGFEVKRVQIINDRGIAICKSMLAWQLFAEGATPASSGIKPDHFVGQYYVRFEQEFTEEYNIWLASDEGHQVFKQRKEDNETIDNFKSRFKNEYFNQHSALGEKAKQMLLKWEDGDRDTLDLWRRMNQWVYEGFEATYRRLGVDYDQLYYESETYLLGKKTVEDGLAQEVFYQKEDGSVWVDLSDEGLDQKLLLRSDGTSVYMTQDIGTALLRNEDFSPNKMVYIVADEQNYHFDTLFKILKKLRAPFADGLYHLNYGMIDLPTGKMKSREGKVVDADVLMDEVIAAATANSLERGSLDDLSEVSQNEIFTKIGLAALKFFIIKVNPRKRMVFNPAESVDLQGQTGPYVQNAYVRIQSVLKRYKESDYSNTYEDINEIERGLILLMSQYPGLIQSAANEMDPSLIANYCYQLAKQYHRFYHDCPILNADSEDTKRFRLQLSSSVATVLSAGMDLLGIEMPEKM
jgi:arginyl-tRNA synthetase